MSQRPLPRFVRRAAVALILSALAACTAAHRESAYYYSGLKDYSAPSTVGAAKVEPKPVTQVAVVAPPKPAARTQPPAPRADQCSESTECMARLKRMVADPDRSWIGKPESAASFVTGTRLFAYRALLPQLTCGELAAARLDIAGAVKQLETPGTALATSQIEKTMLLADDVAVEIDAERNKRC